MAKKSKIAFVFILLSFLVVQGAQADDEWKFGLGTGFFALNLDGDIGLNTISGPAKLDVDLDNSDVSDLLDSAFGLSGFAAKDKWRYNYSVSYMKLEGDGSANIGATPVTADVSFESTKAGAHAEYRFAQLERNEFGVLFGANYTKHDIENDLTIGGTPSKRKLDNNWVDAVVGLTHAMSIGPKVSWSSRIQGEFGGSEGTLLIDSGINWQVANHWILRLYGRRTAVDYENDKPGDPEYYIYDVDEFGAGFGVTYLF